MPLKYKCLILDHDDTSVKSTPDIHYPSFVQALKELRPNEKPITFEEFVDIASIQVFLRYAKTLFNLLK
jgi:phosphoglycolate phosphatase